MELVNPLSSYRWTEPLDVGGGVRMLGVPEKQGWSFFKVGFDAARRGETADADAYGAEKRTAIRPHSAPTLAWMREMYARKEVPDWPPYWIIEPVATCGRKCGWCSINVLERIDPEGKKVRPGMMPWDAFYKLMVECGQHRSVGLSLYQLGEPTDYVGRADGNRKDIADMVTVAKSVGGFKIVNISTHGDCRPERYDRLLECPLDDLIISLDAITPETYMRVRPSTNNKHEGSYERTVERVHRFLTEKVRRGLDAPFVRMQIVNSGDTKDEVLPFIRYWLGVEGVNSVFVKSLDSMRPWLKDKVVSDEEDAIKASAIGDMPCQHLWAIGSVVFSGVLNGCCHDAKTELTDGSSIQTTPYYDWWHGPYMTKLRQAHLTANFPPVCRDCRERDPWLG
jgi:wyosine [tRNA(Phe)-imidazoG37] synthetase (radical SAM superfamily)